jgi:dihydroxyacetone kinase
MQASIDSAAVSAALGRAGARLIEIADRLNQLDAAMGDGDCGISMGKGGEVLRQLGLDQASGLDIGQLLVKAGMAFNKVAPSTLGTVVATGLLAAGKEARGKTTLEPAAISALLLAASAAVQKRGEVQPGDKTIVDALAPAVETYAAAVRSETSAETAAAVMLQAARAGRDAATPLKSRKGRGTWVGERSIGCPDPGAVMFVAALEAVLRCPHDAAWDGPV